MNVTCHLLHFWNEDGLGIVFSLLPQGKKKKKNRSQNSVCLLLCIWKLIYHFFLMKWQRELLEISTQPSEGGCLSEVVLCLLTFRSWCKSPSFLRQRRESYKCCCFFTLCFWFFSRQSLWSSTSKMKEGWMETCSCTYIPLELINHFRVHLHDLIDLTLTLCSSLRDYFSSGMKNWMKFRL